MSRVLNSTGLTAMLVAILLSAAACSSGSDTTAAADGGSSDATVEETNSDSDESSQDQTAAVDGGDGANVLTCDEATDPSIIVRGSNSWLTATAAGNGGDLDPDYDSTLEAIEALRPIQDIEGIFGSMREGLDNMEADVIAAREGRNADMGGEYNIVAMNAVVGEEIC